ncbi:MAG: hypothetical protein H6818_00310 [Phycisphaerales bacterium]|nr:hypothetical protein [Phycisphaerales bacterium]MCB9864961.1 hypothetical protein [Phycisphaerales bacterium]
MAGQSSEITNLGVPDFESHVVAVLGRLRAAFAELFQAVGADATRPQDVARDFGLNRTMTWKISKVICEPDAAAAVGNLPGRAGLNIVLDTFKRSGAPVAILKEVRDALAAFDAMQEVHAGDRDTLEAMLGAMSGGPDAYQQLENQRKAAFRANSAIWGVQARLQVCVNMIAPSEDPDFVDLVWISGLIDFRRLRRDAVWAVASTRKVDDEGKAIPTGKIESVDPAYSGDDNAPLMGSFCSDPTPELRLNQGADGILRYELVEGPIGNTAAMTCIIGIFGRAFVRRTKVPGDTIGEHLARLYTPAELLIHDLFVHKDITNAHDPTIHLYDQLPIAPPYPVCGRERSELPFAESVQALGHGSRSAVVPEFPRYGAIIDSACERLAWDPKAFLGFRFRLKYPPIPSVALFRYPLADR